MKIGYDNDGTIRAVSVDSENIVAENILTIADDLDVLTTPLKYRVVGGAVEINPAYAARVVVDIAAVLRAQSGE